MSIFMGECRAQAVLPGLIPGQGSRDFNTRLPAGLKMREPLDRRDFTAWLGLTPRQNSSGGKQALGAITKQGNRYIRKLLVLGATSLLNVVGKRKGALRDWIVGLLAKKPARLVTVALANKLARILWAMMKTGESFRTEMFAKA